MPAPAARSRSARLPCGTSSSSIRPARYRPSKIWLSAWRGKLQMILRTRPVFSSAARPVSPLPALLFTTVSSRAPCSIRPSISSVGMPAVPKPPISTVAPSAMPASASATEVAILLIICSRLQGSGADARHAGGRRGLVGGGRRLQHEVEAAAHERGADAQRLVAGRRHAALEFDDQAVAGGEGEIV